ncbi:MAG: 4Fe-4S binding protein [Calditrichia bacterium]
MCEFCTKHGEGKKWYLNASNYATELLKDLERQKFIEHFFEEVIRKGNRKISYLEKIFQGKMLLPQRIRQRLTNGSLKSHFGQVIPLEEIPKILAMATSVTRITCGCRWAAEKQESRTCYGISTGPPDWYDHLDLDFFGSPELSSFEVLSPEVACHAMAEDDRKGMVHSLWTFGTPFIGAICNCESQYCLALRSTVGQKIPVMFRAEYIAAIDQSKCNGCRACERNCQFNAIEFNGKKQPSRIDPQKCFGCGVCRAVCPEEAISLQQRTAHPVAAHLWM